MKKGALILSNLTKNFTSSIHGSFDERKDAVAAYRFLSNSKVDERILIDGIIKKTSERVKHKRVMVLCDTTEYNIENHKERITNFEGIGSTSKNDVLGFFSQNQLVVDRNNEQILGWANIKLFNRPVDNQAFVRSNSSVSIKQKESNKWYEPSLYSRDKVLKDSQHCLYISDRESDIYEVLSKLPNERCDILIRAKHNRIIINQDGNRIKIQEDISVRSPKCKVYLEVDGESKKREKRKARCELKYETYTIPRPIKIYDKDEYPETIELTLIQIKEVGKIPKREKAIEWNLWTSEKVNCNAKAVELLECYASRWTIEEAHRLLKKKGFDIESSELESGKGIRKLLILGMEASIKIMTLKAARSGNTDYKVVEIFEVLEIKMLEQLNQKLKGSTELLSNPYDKNNLAWASWIIARLGGWKGYNSQRPPGTITFKRGLDRFYDQYDGFLLAIKLHNCV